MARGNISSLTLLGMLDEMASWCRRNRPDVFSGRPADSIFDAVDQNRFRYCGGDFCSFFCCSALAFSACCFCAFDCAAVGGAGCAFGGCEG